MMFEKKTTRIIFFLGSLRAGGKERRLIELLTYLKKKGNYKMMVVLTEDVIHFPDFHKLGVKCTVLEKSLSKYDPTIFYKFYKVCKSFKPNLIHSWGAVQSFYSLPAVKMLNIPLVNSQITAAPPQAMRSSFSKLIDNANFKYSKLIISNSKAGLNAFSPPLEKSKVIYNGINLNRFKNLPTSEEMRSKYGIKTPYAVAMVASISPNKDYDRFVRVAEKVTALRNDVTFIGIGGYCDGDEKYKELVDLTESRPRIVFSGVIDEVEALVNACDIGILFSNKEVHGEGISNSIMEYMSLAKPVIANNAGGTSEILRDKVSGFLVDEESDDELAAMVLELIDNQEKREGFGQKGREIIENVFSLEKMGESFEKAYMQALSATGYEVETFQEVYSNNF
ncbi:glycosyltransferase family 4 protein [Litoribacter ruber]|uniref:glycosyltransferase family 4 protein n=1 Tax=Litoribacter ruber TaxID=702568 RepID=UPI001FE4CAB9|nr:glycosyltransferase family 4 protein [Litoribacter ruber]